MSSSAGTRGFQLTHKLAQKDHLLLEGHTQKPRGSEMPTEQQLLITRSTVANNAEINPTGTGPYAVTYLNTHLNVCLTFIQLGRSQTLGTRG